MTSDPCRDWRGALGAAALGRLEPAEEIGLRAHLDGCAAMPRRVARAHRGRARARRQFRSRTSRAAPAEPSGALGGPRARAGSPTSASVRRDRRTRRSRCGVLGVRRRGGRGHRHRVVRRWRRPRPARASCMPGVGPRGRGSATLHVGIGRHRGRHEGRGLAAGPLLLALADRRTTDTASQPARSRERPGRPRCGSWPRSRSPRPPDLGDRRQERTSCSTRDLPQRLSVRGSTAGEAACA